MVEKIFDRMGKLGFVMLAGGLVGTRFIFVVDGGERALKMNNFKGLSPIIYGEGMHFRWPFIEQIKRFEIRTQPTLIHSVTGTRDLQQANISMRVLFRPVESKLAVILNQIGADYDQRILPSLGNEVLKSTVA